MTTGNSTLEHGFEGRSFFRTATLSIRPLSVRVPDMPEKIAPGVDKYESTIEPLRSESRFPRVGEEVQATRYVMRIPYTGPENISTRGFPGGRYRQTKAPPGEPVDAAHHVGPMETLESLVVNDEPGTQQIFWENRGRPECATQYDGPAPDVPIHAELTVTKYAVAIQKSANDTLTVINKLAEVEGGVELYDATLQTTQLEGAGSRASGLTERTLPAGITRWRVRVTTDSALTEPADVYLLSCAGNDGCAVLAQGEIAAPGKTLIVEKPQEGARRIVVRSRGQVSHGSHTPLDEALLVPLQRPSSKLTADVRAERPGRSLCLGSRRTHNMPPFEFLGHPATNERRTG